jgi:hypothetical protein
MFRDRIIKNKSIQKMIKKIANKRIKTKFDIELNENKCLGMRLEKNKLIKKMIKNRN